MSIIRNTLARAALAALLLVSACARLIGTPPPSPENDLTTTLVRAESEVLGSRFGVADRLLADFAVRHPASPEMYEATFWRALYKLDPANQTASPREVVPLVNAYLASSPTAPRRAAASTLRRLATALDRPAAPPVVSSSDSLTAPAAKAPDKLRDEEIQRLKEELAKANAELERIKRRLAQPNP